MAEKSQIIDAIEALAVHCRPPIMSVEQRSLWMRDWASDLSEFPLEAITNACRKWRMSGASKFPTPGQIMPLVRESLPAERREAVRVWRQATPDEYANMTIREKIRELQILAHDAFSKAGPMFRNTSAGHMGRASGVHLPAEEMPGAHAAWISEGQRHNDEIKRLRQYIHGRPAVSEAAE